MIVELTDFWEVFDTFAEARARYDEVLDLPDLYSASIVKPIVSTDYDDDRRIVVWSVRG